MGNYSHVGSSSPASAASFLWFTWLNKPTGNKIYILPLLLVPPLKPLSHVGLSMEQVPTSDAMGVIPLEGAEVDNGDFQHASEVLGTYQLKRMPLGCQGC